MFFNSVRPNKFGFHPDECVLFLAIASMCIKTLKLDQAASTQMYYLEKFVLIAAFLQFN